MADSNGEIKGFALDLLFEDFNDEVETILDQKFNGEIEEAMNEVIIYLFSIIHSQVYHQDFQLMG